MFFKATRSHCYCCCWCQIAELVHLMRLNSYWWIQPSLLAAGAFNYNDAVCNLAWTRLHQLLSNLMVMGTQGRPLTWLGTVIPLMRISTWHSKSRVSFWPREGGLTRTGFFWGLTMFHLGFTKLCGLTVGPSEVFKNIMLVSIVLSRINVTEQSRTGRSCFQIWKFWSDAA